MFPFPALCPFSPSSGNEIASFCKEIWDLGSYLILKSNRHNLNALNLQTLGLKISDIQLQIRLRLWMMNNIQYYAIKTRNYPNNVHIFKASKVFLHLNKHFLLNKSDAKIYILSIQFSFTGPYFLCYTEAGRGGGFASFLESVLCLLQFCGLKFSRYSK